MELPNALTVDEALRVGTAMLRESRRLITFPAQGELLTMPLEEVRGIVVTVDGAYFEIIGVADKWSIETGMSREITAREKSADELKDFPPLG